MDTRYFEHYIPYIPLITLIAAADVVQRADATLRSTFLCVFSSTFLYFGFRIVTFNMCGPKNPFSSIVTARYTSVLTGFNYILKFIVDSIYVYWEKNERHHQKLLFVGKVYFS